MSSPVERIAALTVGTVESVSPSEIRVLLDPDAPQAVAINAGTPIGFPRINGYVLIPNESGAVVGLIVWLGVERSVYPKRSGLKDFGLVDLPFPSRKLVLTPLGTLRLRDVGRGGACVFELARGVSVFPCVGDAVQLPTSDQLRGIIESCKEPDQRVRIGTSPLAAHASVTVDPDKLFGRHLAVLGNTGSGKSCSVAGLIRWSMEEARAKRNDGRHANARFIVLDPNGEYASAFKDFTDLRLFQVDPSTADIPHLRLPAWMWNSQEWAAFAQAAPGVQRPLLLQALRNMRSGALLEEPAERKAARIVSDYGHHIEAFIASGLSAYQEKPGCYRCGEKLMNLVADMDAHAAALTGRAAESLAQLSAASRMLATSHSFPYQGGTLYRGFSQTELQGILEAVKAALEHLPASCAEGGVSEDAPVPFALSELPDHLEQLASDVGGPQAFQFISTLCMRIRMMLAEGRLGPVVNPAEEPAVSLDSWLEDYVGANEASNGELAVIDLSLVPSDIVHLITAVIGRVVFEAVQRYRKQHGYELPTVLVLEEAHTFVKRGTDVEDNTPSATQMCRQTFERIAREGRKFGLGLVLSSQRPSELSPTVLAQCNTFLIHRIVNDRDQELLGKLVPDNLGGLLGELPSLPTRHAVLLGWAVPLPTLVEVRELPELQRPRSDDPHFWDVWTGKAERRIDWGAIAADWTGVGSATPAAEVGAQQAPAPRPGRQVGTERTVPDADL